MVLFLRKYVQAFVLHYEPPQKAPYGNCVAERGRARGGVIYALFFALTGVASHIEGREG